MVRMETQESGWGDRDKDTRTVRDGRPGIQHTQPPPRRCPSLCPGERRRPAPGVQEGATRTVPISPCSGRVLGPARTNRKCQAVPSPPPQGVGRLPLDSNDSSTSPASMGIRALAGLRDLGQGPSLPRTSDHPSVAIGSRADRTLPPPGCVASGKCLFLSEAQAPLVSNGRQCAGRVLHSLSHSQSAQARV